MSSNFTADEEQRVRAQWIQAGAAKCPRCSDPLTARRIAPRPDVPYVRDRLWLVCGGCGRSAVVDRRRLTSRD